HEAGDNLHYTAPLRSPSTDADRLAGGWVNNMGGIRPLLPFDETTRIIALHHDLYGGTELLWLRNQNRIFECMPQERWLRLPGQSLRSAPRTTGPMDLSAEA